MVHYISGNKKIKSLAEKCISGKYPLSCEVVGQSFDGKGENEKWSYEIRTPRAVIGEFDYFPLDHKVEVRALPDEPFTFGENYRKRLESNLQTLIKVEFSGTVVKD